MVEYVVALVCWYVGCFKYIIFLRFNLMHVLSCYKPSVISVTVTKGGYLRGSRLYKISKTIRRGVAELRRKFSI